MTIWTQIKLYYGLEDKFPYKQAKYIKNDKKASNKGVSFVFVDSSNFMFKYKCEYYKYWKFLRGQVESISRGKSPKIDHPFLKWVMRDKNRCYKDIITLRDEYIEQEGKIK